LLFHFFVLTGFEFGDAVTRSVAALRQTDIIFDFGWSPTHSHDAPRALFPPRVWGIIRFPGPIERQGLSR
jgi:hypothetical protein